MFFYAQLNQDDIVTAISQLNEAVDSPQMIELTGLDSTLIGKHFMRGTGEFHVATPPEATPLPKVVITNITVDQEHAAKAQIAADFSAIKLPVGASVTVDAELQFAGQRIAGFAADFAMPLRSTDGLMRYLDVHFVDGRATFSALMSDSKRWEVNKTLVNSSLPPEAQMDFDGIVITAVE